MGKSYLKHGFFCVLGLLMITFYSCKKDSNNNNSNPTPSGAKPLATIGLYEQLIDTNYRRIYVAISKVGTQTPAVPYHGIFDTGSTGMTIDADGLLPGAMVTANGIQVPGDSVVVNGITVTNQQAMVSYGDTADKNTEYGNVAYADVTIGDQNGGIVAKRIPIFLYYKIVNTQTGNTLPAHSNDVFGVGPGVSQASSLIGSPLSYFGSTGTLTSGFKLAKLDGARFVTAGSYVANLLTIGLVPNDLTSSGFMMHSLTYGAQGGYSPDIPATINYNGKDIAATVLFDTGNPSATIIEDNSISSGTSLPANSTVSLTTAAGFNYSYTTSPGHNLTQVSTPSVTADPRSIFSIDFFISNEFLINYATHQIGLKNN